MSSLDHRHIRSCHLVSVIISYVSQRDSRDSSKRRGNGMGGDVLVARDQIYETHLKPRKMFIKLPASSQ